MSTLLLQDSERLALRMSELPVDPGVYLMKDLEGAVIYIGKAKNLRNRVRTYFQAGTEHSPKTQIMVQQVADFELILTDTEAEALTLEENLVKDRQPRYNILLKDDKQYPFLCITWSEEYPRILVCRPRGYRKPKDKYFGPYVDAGALHETVKFLKRVFPLRQRPTPVFKDRPCINYDMGRCPGICQRLITPADYRKTIEEAQQVIQGKTDELVQALAVRMGDAAEELHFEAAAKFRDQIQNLEMLSERQKMSIPDPGISRDAVALAADSYRVVVQIFQVRKGKLIGRLGFSFQATQEEPGPLLQTVLEKHYRSLDPEDLPLEILTQHELPTPELLEAWLSESKGRKVTIKAPQRQMKAELIELVVRNAELELQRLTRSSDVHQQALVRLMEVLDLPSPPQRLECYDISHIQGTDTVASRVVFVNGKPCKADYRHYKIRDPKIQAGQPDDFASMAEVIGRRFKPNQSEELPDLVVIDGGKGQLSSARAVMEELGVDHLPTIGLAKRMEEIFKPQQSKPILLDHRDVGLQLLQQIRDEAHRFAITYHRNLRGKRMTTSALDEIPGLGPSRQDSLLKQFSSVPKLCKASIEEIAGVPGISQKLARVIYSHFHPS